MNEFYSSDLFSEWEVGDLRSLDQSPILKVYTDAIITGNGCLNSNNQIITESVHTRGKATYPSGKPTIPSKESPIIDRAYFFGYANTSHWGHYLTETIARSSHLDMGPIDVYYFGNISKIKNLYPQHKYISITSPIKCKTLYVPEPTMVNLWNIFPEHIQACQSIGDMYGREILPNKRVYLSRTTQPKSRRWTEGEPELAMI